MHQRRIATDARRLAFWILQRVEEQGAFAGPLLEHHAGKLRDPREVALVQELVLGVLRRRGQLDAALEQVVERPLPTLDSPVLRALRLGAYAILFLQRVPSFAAVSTAVELVKGTRHRWASGLVNAALRRLAELGQHALPPPPPEGDTAGLARAGSHPEWWVRRQVERRGWQATRGLLEAHSGAAPSVLRPNLKRTTPRELAQRLRAEGVRTEPGRVVPEALRVVEGRPQHTAAFAEGWFWIQDEASQLVPLMLGRVLRPRVADLCAAPGTKTFQLAEALPRGGSLVVLDRHAARMGRLLAGLERLGLVEGVLPVLGDVAAGPPLREGFDHVLLDAPCTGTGTLRRHPEIRWRLTLEDVRRLADLQSRMLEQAQRLVVPGGTLVYSVCSLEPEEGEEVIAGFLARHPQWRLLDPRPRLPEAAREFVGEDGALRTSPDRCGLDGFFAVLLQRTGEPPRGAASAGRGNPG